MFSNYLKIGLRNFLRHKFFSLLNILGLAVSMSVGLLIIMLVKDAHSYDHFHPNGDRVFRMLTEAQRKGGGAEPYASSPYPVGKALSEEYPYTEAWAPLVRIMGGGQVKVNERNFSLDNLLTAPSFFEVFGFELESGDPTHVLAEPFQIVITHETAERFFKGENPIGKIITYPQYGNFQVTGVLKPAPGKTHLEFEALSSIATLETLEKNPDFFKVTDNWNNYYSGYNYFLLRKDIAPGQVETALAAIAKQRYADLTLESRDAGYQFNLQALDEITPGPIFSNNMGRGVPLMMLWFFSALGLLVIGSACFNYTNLTLARALSRTKEIGIRKVTGAGRRHIIAQMLTESVLTAFVSLLAAYQLLRWIIPGFNQLSFLSELDISLKEDTSTYAYFIGFAVVVGTIAGLLPALSLSVVKPVAMFQQLENVRLLKRVGLRRVLIVFQFAISLLFLIVITVQYRQMKYMLTMDYGFNRENMLNIDLQQQSYATAVNEISKVPGVIKVSAMSHRLGTWEDNSVDVRINMGDESVGIRDFFVDENLIDNLQLSLLAGKNFTPRQAQEENSVIVNETFLKHFKLGSPAEALGKPLLLGDSNQVVISGVVKDFLFRPATYAIGPLLMRYNTNQLHILNARISSNDYPATIAALEKAWKKLDAQGQMAYAFYDDTINQSYAPFKDMLWIVSFISFLSVTIACLGLLGIATYTVETRRKEISIRKVIGATWIDLTTLLSKHFFILLGIAAVVAVPLGFVIGKMLLQNFAFRIPFSWTLFLPGILFIAIIAVLTIGSQTLRASLANPVKNLRSE